MGLKQQGKSGFWTKEQKLLMEENVMKNNYLSFTFFLKERD